MMRQTPFQVTNALYRVVFIGLVLALVSVYFRLGGRARALGAVGFCFALVGTLDMAGNMWLTASPAPGSPMSPPTRPLPAGLECW